MRFAWTTFSNHTWRLLIHKLTGLMKSRAYNPSALAHFYLFFVREVHNRVGNNRRRIKFTFRQT